jgi:hypothetical protein
MERDILKTSTKLRTPFARTSLVGEVEVTVLRHPERLDIAIVCAALLAFMVKLLISLIREHDIVDILAIVVLWGVGFLAVLAMLIWSVAVSTVVRKGSEDLTISWALGRLVCREARSVFLKDLTEVVARERAYGFKGRKTRRYEILFGPPDREKSELLGHLTREHVEKLASGVLRGILPEAPLGGSYTRPRSARQ